MNREEPKVAKEGRYPTCEAARRLGCHRNTLKRYAGVLRINPRMNPNNNRRFYTGEQLIRIWRAAN
jgi:DNA-binding transcriptional MerR regulator